jgi:hypothetical protein
MTPYCFEHTYTLPAFYLAYPWFSAVALVLMGLGIAISWMKLRRWWRAIPVVLALSLVGLAMLPQAKLHLKMSEAARILQAGTWRASGDKFVLGGAEAKITAYRVPVSSKCNVGFIVETTDHPASFFQPAFARSPAEVTLLEFQDISLSRNKLCQSKLFVDERAKPSQGYRRSCDVPLEFLDASRAGRPSFEMRWCRVLDDEHLYCEADRTQVAVAKGIEF